MLTLSRNNVAARCLAALGGCTVMLEMAYTPLVSVVSPQMGSHVLPPPSGSSSMNGSMNGTHHDDEQMHGGMASGAEGGGTLVTVQLTGALGQQQNGSAVAGARVFFGMHECPVSEVSYTPPPMEGMDEGATASVHVPVCAFAAGSYPVSVLVPSLGWALGAAGRGEEAENGLPSLAVFSFTQMLRVDSVSPALGSWYGGSRVTISGAGFGGGSMDEEEHHTPVRSTVSIAGLECEVAFENHTTIECYTSAVPAWRSLSAHAGHLTQRVGSGGVCTAQSNGDGSSLDACYASCDELAGCNLVNYRAYPRQCQRRACASSCAAGACDIDGTSAAEWVVRTTLDLGRFLDGSAPVSVRVATAGGGEMEDMLPSAFAYDAAANAPQLSGLTTSGGGVGSSLELALVGSGLGTTAGLVTIGHAAMPSRNLQFALTAAWSDTLLGAERASELVPAGSWSVRAWVPGYNGYSSTLSLAVAAQPQLAAVNGVEVNVTDPATAALSTALRSGLGGGLELTLSGAGLGLEAAQTTITVCGLECTPTASNGSHASCTAPPIATRELVEAFPDSFKPADLFEAAAELRTNRAAAGDEVEEQFVIDVFGGTIDTPNTLQAPDGSWRHSSSGDCWYAFSLPPSQAALVSSAKFFPPVDPTRREYSRLSKLEVRNLTVGAGSEHAAFDEPSAWVVVADVADAVVSGASIAQGWNAWSVSPPVVAQAFRVRVPNAACRRPGDLLRGARFDGTIALASDDASSCPIELAQVHHPLSDTPAVPAAGSLGARLVHTMERTPTLDSLSPSRGTARGGTLVAISGSNLDPLDASGSTLAAADALEAVQVELGGYPCAVQAVSATEITCVSGARSDGLFEATSRVWVGGRGAGLRSDVVGTEFIYIDRWSDERSWLDSEKPMDGDTVIVPEGQSILLDEDSGQLFLLLVQGRLEFDRADLHLQATYILVAGGTFLVGTEAEPFEQRATITLHGDRWRTIELPFIGSKMLAVTNLGGLHGGCHEAYHHGGAEGAGYSASDPCPVRKVGHLALHGKPVRSWTRLNRTAEEGETALSLAEPVDWPVGAKLLITRSWQGHADEERTVAAVEDGGHTLVLDRALSRAHLGEWHWHDENALPSDLRAAVALLERNVVVQGDESTLRAGGSYQFGAHLGGFFGGIFRLSNVEVTRSGQAGNFGRYSSHWHRYATGRNIDIIDRASYFESNVYHHTFQRAVVVHGTDFAQVRNCVAYKAQGHNFFTEEGHERFALFEHNLAVAAVPHPILLGDDTTPAGASARAPL
jgi:hypothetical protein